MKTPSASQASRTDALRLPALLVIAVALLAAGLACQADAMRARDLPVWTCPTETPIPTDTMPEGWEQLTPPPATYTPYPSPTPFELLTDFPLGKHVRVGNVGGVGLGVWVWMDRVQVDGPFTIEDPVSGMRNQQWVASWDVTVENGSLSAAYEFYPFAQVYVLEVVEPNGEMLDRGAWGVSGEADDLIGLPPLELSKGATHFGPGEQRTVRVAALIPGPGVSRIGYVFDPLDTQDLPAMAENHSLGSNVGVWINAYDDRCQNGEVTIQPGQGGPAMPGVYVPGYLLTRHPVDTVHISRGFGCSEWFTGELGTNCPASAPWFHNGVDYAISPGSSYIDPLPVPGAVSYAGVDVTGPDCSSTEGSQPPHTGYGNYIRHSALVDGHQVILWGGHLSGFNTRSGASTVPGEVLGFTGSTGCSTGPHLHFAVRVDGRFVDPLTLIP